MLPADGHKSSTVMPNGKSEISVKEGYKKQTLSAYGIPKPKEVQRKRASQCTPLGVNLFLPSKGGQ